MPPIARPYRLAALALAPVVVVLALAPPAAVAGGGGDVSVAEETPSPAPPPPAPAATVPAEDCAGGVVYDSGEVGTGYGFVPSAKYGIYVQEFAAADLASRELATVCVCWLRTRGESHRVPFEVVLYADAGGRPAEEPLFVRQALATDVAASVETAGRFTPVDVRGATIPAGERFYLGVRWDPSDARFAFVCTDTAEATRKRRAWFREDRQPAWADVWTAKDPIFRPHRAIAVRAVALPAAAGAVPTATRPAASATAALD